MIQSHEASLASVQDYYGKVLASNKDLKTSACCVAEAPPEPIRSILQSIHPEVLEKFYGCGFPIPALLTGLTVLDLGSGSGRDCFVLSKLVGPKGRVIGVDMTKNQVATAEKYRDFHAKAFDYSASNVEFRQGYIEDLASVGIETGSVDLVISNCVINLSPAKEQVFAEIFRVLKPGGELYFSDVFSSQRIPKHLKNDPILLGECLGGALYIEDFRRMLSKIGCHDYRVLAKSKITITDPEIYDKIGMLDFYSFTIRAFKLDLEDRCEDYGQIASYLGSIDELPHSFILDDHHIFKTGRPALVCSNTAAMLQNTRFAQHFKIIGDTTQHFGLFDCGPTPGPAIGADSLGACC